MADVFIDSSCYCDAAYLFSTIFSLILQRLKQWDTSKSFWVSLHNNQPENIHLTHNSYQGGKVKLNFIDSDMIADSWPGWCSLLLLWKILM